MSHIVKMNYFFKKSSSLLPEMNRQTKYKVMMIKEEFTKIVNFMTTRGMGSWAGVWPYKSYSENALFL